MADRFNFKVFLKSANEMLQIWDFDGDDFKSYFCSGPDFDHVFIQCTGLKDYKGNEIWGGDLLKADSPDNKHSSNYVVKWKDAGFYLHHNYENCEFWEPLEGKGIVNFKLLVVGNIYEHPKLIEKHLNIKA